MKRIPAYFFDAKDLKKNPVEFKRDFEQARPFRHIVIDDFLPRSVLRSLIDEFPNWKSPIWKLHGPGQTKHTGSRKTEKLGARDESKFKPFTRHFLQQLNSHTFLSFLESATGISGLLPDPSYSGGGLHSTGRGGRLMIHTDPNRHPNPKRRIQQMLNLILYLNDDWKEEYGGHLELWNKDLKCEKKILPIANRLVLFYTGAETYHGHPSPLRCPSTRRRNSIALYYYTLDRPQAERHEGNQISSKWMPTEPQDFEVANKTTAQFNAWLQARHGEVLEVSSEVVEQMLMGDLFAPSELKKHVPLYFFDWFRLAKKQDLIKSRFSESGNRINDATPTSGMAPFAVLGVSSKSGLYGRKGVTLWVDRSRAHLYFSREPEHPLRWLASADLMFKIF